MLSLVLGLAFSVFSVFCFWLSSFAKKQRKEEDAFLATKRRERLTIHTRTHTHTNIIIIMVFTTVLSTVRVVASSVSRHSLSFSILPRFSLSLSLSLRARMRAVLASRLFSPLFYPFLKKCIITHRRNNNNHNNSEPKLSLARPHRRRALSP